MLLIFLLFVGSVDALLDDESPRIVNTSQGLVRGYREQNGSHFAFYGIPYATTPLGMNRFKAPLPPHTWSDIFNATEKNIVCPQPRRLQENLIYQEDCLNLNVFVPYSDEVNNNVLPVLVYIHGGAFIHSGDRGGCENLVKHGVIVVTIEYRVGVLGFLCLGIEEAPGNAGIKDQVAALQWIKKNIANFGGEPNNVTVYGTSAGAIALDILMLSGKANGLFERAILESGSALVGGFGRDNFKQAKDMAVKMGFHNTTDAHELLMFFKTLPSSVLAMIPMEEFLADSKVGICIESFKSNTSILTDHPMKLIEKSQYKQIPYIIGFGSLEGIVKSKDFQSIRNDINSNFTKVFSHKPTINDKKTTKLLINKIKKAYFGKEDIKSNENFIKFCTDGFVAYPLLVSVINNARRSKIPVYLYEFSYDGGLGLPRENFKHLVGARHSDFWAYIFTHGVSANRTDDRLTADRLSTLVTNFVKFGDPTPSSTHLLSVKWTPVNNEDGKNSINYLSIGKEIEMRSNMFDARLNLMDKLYGCQVCSKAALLLSGFKCLLGLPIAFFFKHY